MSSIPVLFKQYLTYKEMGVVMMCTMPYRESTTRMSPYQRSKACLVLIVGYTGSSLPVSCKMLVPSPVDMSNWQTSRSYRTAYHENTDGVGAVRGVQLLVTFLTRPAGKGGKECQNNRSLEKERHSSHTIVPGTGGAG